MSDESTTCRFYFHDPERLSRSAVWRIWAGRAGNDLYVARGSLAGELKLSIHPDVNQLGYYADRVRSQIRAADSHVIRRWTREDASVGDHGTQMLCLLAFNSAEFEPLEMPRSTERKPVLALESAPVTQSNLVGVVHLPDGIDSDTLGSRVLAEFPSAWGGSFVVTVSHGPLELFRIGAVDTDTGIGWSPPGARGSDEPFGFAFGWSPCANFAEFSSERHQPPSVSQLANLNARLSVWDSVPEPWRSDAHEVCAVLVCATDGSNATLYVDPRSRCGHGHLVSDTNDLIAALASGRRDQFWNQHADGTISSGILTRIDAEAQGVTDFGTNPMKPPTL